MSLDFSPDGSGDVRLKLAERSGEVHVSLHSNDAELTHQLREGIHDLAAALSSAGYEAEAWTSGQGRDANRRQQQEPQRFGRQVDSDAFDGVLSETGQEPS